MLVYSSDKTTFLDDVRRNRISDRILGAMKWTPIFGQAAKL